MNSKEVMKRVYKDGYLNRHAKNEIKLKDGTPLYTMFVHEDEYYKFYNITAYYGSGVCNSWLFYDAKSALNTFRRIVGVES